MFFFKKRLKKATAEDDKKFREMMQENDVGKKDSIAMVLAALLVLVLPCLLVLLGISLLALFLFGVL